MTEHTKEPWKSVERSWHHEYAADLAGPDGRLVASIKHSEDARRIVACVNACAGIPTEALESVRHAGFGDPRFVRASSKARLHKLWQLVRAEWQERAG